jgi:hypothetical protein
MRRAQHGYALCRRHSDVVAGVMLGVCASGLLEDALKKFEKKRSAEKLKRTDGKTEGAASRQIKHSQSFNHHEDRLLPGRTRSPNLGKIAESRSSKTEKAQTMSGGARDGGAVRKGKSSPDARSGFCETKGNHCHKR